MARADAGGAAARSPRRVSEIAHRRARIQYVRIVAMAVAPVSTDSRPRGGPLRRAARRADAPPRSGRRAGAGVAARAPAQRRHALQVQAGQRHPVPDRVRGAGSGRRAAARATRRCVSCCSCARAIPPRRPGRAGGPASRAPCATSAPTRRSSPPSWTTSWPRSSAGARGDPLPVRARAGAGRGGRAPARPAARGRAPRRRARRCGSSTRALTLHEMRLIKSPQEVAIQRRAAEITAEAHIAAMLAARDRGRRARDRGAGRLHVPQERRHRSRAIRRSSAAAPTRRSSTTSRTARRWCAGSCC